MLIVSSTHKWYKNRTIIIKFLTTIYFYIYDTGFSGVNCEIDDVIGCETSDCSIFAMCQDTPTGFNCLCPIDSTAVNERSELSLLYVGPCM